MNLKMAYRGVVMKMEINTPAAIAPARRRPCAGTASLCVHPDYTVSPRCVHVSRGGTCCHCGGSPVSPYPHRGGVTVRSRTNFQEQPNGFSCRIIGLRLKRPE